MGALFFVFECFTAIRGVAIVLIPEFSVLIPVAFFPVDDISSPHSLTISLSVSPSFLFSQKNYPVFVTSHPAV